MKRFPRFTELKEARRAKVRWVKKVRRQRSRRKIVYHEVRITPPEKFGFSENYKETVECLIKLKTAALLPPPQKWVRNKVFIDLAPIKEISTAAALVLAAEIDRWRRRQRGPIQPRNVENWDPRVRSILEELGFFNLLGVGRLSHLLENSGFDEITVLPLVACNTLDRSRLADIQDHLQAVAHAFHQDPSIYTALTEATYNSLKHAYPPEHKFDFPPLGKYWWATGSWSPERSEVRFLVYDQGVGIPDTLPKWEHWERIVSWISQRFPGTGTLLQEHANLIEAALEVSRTSLTSGHGQGLRDVLSPIDVYQAGRVRILSGKGQLSYSPDGTVKKQENGLHLGGTLIEWTIPVPKV